MIGTHFSLFAMLLRHPVAFLWLFLGCWPGAITLRLAAAEPAESAHTSISTPATHAAGTDESNSFPRFNVAAYIVEGRPLPATNALAPIISSHTGTDISLEEIVKVARDVQMEYRRQGYPAMSVALAREQITNGIVTLNIFPTVVPQIVVSGVRYLVSTNSQEVASNPPVPEAGANPRPTNEIIAATNAISPAISQPTTPASPQEIAETRAAMLKKMADLDVQQTDRRVHVVSTNAGPRFEVEKYLVTGNSILPPAAVAGAITNIDGAYGTNVSFDGVRTVVAELQRAYRERGYVTVSVGLPQQKLTNAMVKVQVTEGRLADIHVTGNRYFSSNNIMRSLPSLRTNTVLNGLIFQAELNQANANQDRQIYPVIGPGLEPGTSDLTLKVKDQLPLHAKVELNNQNSPGTPDLRVNSSAVYNNLWQLGHSLGIQYGFSPESYKEGKQWEFFDAPLVANYSAFYTLPLGNSEPIEDTIANNPGNFGYDEATRKFNLPPASGQPQLTFFASRATVDTGLTVSPNQRLFTASITNADDTRVTNSTLDTISTHQDLTVNNDLGFRFNLPLEAPADFHSGLSAGLDFKTYKVSSSATNIFIQNVTEIDYNDPNNPIPIPVSSQYFSAVPFTVKDIQYLPLSLHYDAGSRDASGATTFGLGLSVNLWYSSQTTATSVFTDTNKFAYTNTVRYRGAASLQQITGSAKSSGYWVVLTPSFSRTLVFYTNWITSFRLDGQWASEPLISNEQFGAGGVNSVRGYHEGEVFGDCGWHLSLEQQTPPHVVGIAYGNTPLTIRGSVYMDYAKVYLLDPQGRPNNIALWGTGFGLAASIGSHWETRFLFSLPLISTSTTPRDQPYFNFSLTAQF